MGRRTYRIEEMLGFPTQNKRPKQPWRNKDNRWVVGGIFKGYDQAGIVPAEHGCVVLDLDKKNGVDGFMNLRKKFKNLPRSLNYRTASGGHHLWYSVPDDAVIPQRTGKIPGVDIRHADGYVCVGRDYDIRDEEFIEECPKPLLDWLTLPDREHVGRVRSNDYEPTKPKGKPKKVTLNFCPIPVGQRNDGLYRWGFGLLNAVKSGEMSMQDWMDCVHLKGKNSKLHVNEIDLIIDSLLTTLP